jgi:hypothetical protein
LWFALTITRVTDPDMFKDFIKFKLLGYAHSRTECAASVKMRPINEVESDLNEHDGLNLDAACLITWSIDESTPSSCVIDVDETDLWFDSGFEKLCRSRLSAGTLVSMHRC